MILPSYRLEAGNAPGLEYLHGVGFELVVAGKALIQNQAFRVAHSSAYPRLPLMLIALLCKLLAEEIKCHYYIFCHRKKEAVLGRPRIFPNLQSIYDGSIMP